MRIIGARCGVVSGEPFLGCYLWWSGVEVRSTNRTTPDRLDELKRRIDSLQALPDPMALYVSMMSESAQRAGSGLGLARIRVEGEMELAYDIEGDSVTIKCSTPVQ